MSWELHGTSLQEFLLTSAALCSLQRIISKEMAGLEVPAYQLFPRSLPYCDVELHPLIAYDREKAVALLEAAGWRVPSGGGGIRQKGGKKLVSHVHIIHQHLYSW
jgi:ABC-type transport system substrate-binding protein